MKKFLAVFGLIFLPLFAFAQAATEILPADFLAQILVEVKGFGGLPWAGKVAAICLLIVSSMKVSFLNQMIWSKLGKAQAILPIVLGLVGGLLSAGVGGHLPTLAQAMAYMGAGAGAIILYELLDMVKAIPGIGPVWVSLITMIEGYLGGPGAKA